MARCVGSGFDFTFGAFYTAKFDPATQTVTFQIDRHDLGDPTNLLLHVGTLFQSGGGAGAVDLVPNVGLFGYRIATSGTAPPPTSRSIEDPEGDSQTDASDVTRVVVSHDDGGDLTVRITLANRAQLVPGDTVAFWIDTDRNPQTGCGASGNSGGEFAVMASGRPRASALSRGGASERPWISPRRSERSSAPSTRRLAR